MARLPEGSEQTSDLNPWATKWFPLRKLASHRGDRARGLRACLCLPRCFCNLLDSKTYAFQDHIIQVRSYPEGWWRKYEAMIDDWEEVLAGYDSPDDASRAAQVHIKRINKEVQE
jgi:hypothetical protein